MNLTAGEMHRVITTELNRQARPAPGVPKIMGISSRVTCPAADLILAGPIESVGLEAFDPGLDDSRREADYQAIRGDRLVHDGACSDDGLGAYA